MEFTVVGFILITLGGATEHHKRKYHELLQRRAKFVVNHIPGTSFYLINHCNETFAKPAVIVCNHQSHLDLMAIMALTPNLIVLTKDWVWHNPFYGVVIRYADFFPISDTENLIPHIKAMASYGYSIVVFPEGTRSEDCRIQRFHRGAFYIAEELNLDMVTVFIDGFGKVLPKKSCCLHQGETILEIMQRINHCDDMWKNGYRGVSREIHKIYVKHKG